MDIEEGRGGRAAGRRNKTFIVKKMRKRMMVKKIETGEEGEKEEVQGEEGEKEEVQGEEQGSEERLCPVKSFSFVVCLRLFEVHEKGNEGAKKRYEERRLGNA